MTHRPPEPAALIRRSVLVLAAVVALAGCADAYRIRPIQAHERDALGRAAGPLLARLGLLGPGGGCGFGVSLNDVPARQLEVSPSSSPDDCLYFLVTAGALGLPTAELRALVAHGLAHLELGHPRTLGRRAPTRLGRPGAAPGTEPRSHTLDEELEADRHAARLLDSGSGADCLALAAVLAQAVADEARWREWTTMHPATPARVAAARRACERER